MTLEELKMKLEKLENKSIMLQLSADYFSEKQWDEFRKITAEIIKVKEEIEQARA